MNDFNEYIDYYKKLDLKSKQEIVLDEMKLLCEFTNKMCSKLDVKNDMMIHKELLDTEKDNYTEDDFAESLIVYINIIKDSLCDFNLKLMDISKNLPNN